MVSSDDRSKELGEFLRARRSEAAPSGAGIDLAGPRRVPGLRREEIAHLAGISIDYYTRLEQGRLSSASPEVLDALSCALQLNQDARNYLFQLASKPDFQQRPANDDDVVRPQTRQLLDSLRDSAAIVLDRHLDVLAWNKLATAIFKDFETVPKPERNFLRMLFLDPEMRGRYVDWQDQARLCVGFVRATFVGNNEPVLARLIGELSLCDPDFRTWWAELGVSYSSAGSKTLTHPETGPYLLDWQVLSLPEEEQSLMVITAPPGSPSLEILRRLSDGSIRNDLGLAADVQTVDPALSDVVADR